MTNKSGKFGYFNNSKKEYIITTPFTPLPWINYLGNEEYFGIISNTAGGYTFYKDARLMRITRYRYNDIPMDINGRYIYIKKEDGEIFSATCKPCMKVPQFYECHHGMGYTQIISLYKNIKTDVTYFIPLDDNTELWNFRVTNLSDKNIELNIYPFSEFCLWNAYNDFTNYQRNANTGEVYVENDVIYHITEYRERRNHFAYFSCSEKPKSFTARRNEFIGLSSLINEPEMIKAKKLDNKSSVGWAPCSVFQIKISLKPKETKRIIFQLGYSENKKEEKRIKGKLNTNKARAVIDKYNKYSNVDNAFVNLGSYWRNKLNNFQVKTSNKEIDTMVNIWNQYQNAITYKMSRSASFFESGISRGIGFRDSNQDLLGFMHIDPKKTRERIFDLASTQIENGHVYHQYQPLTKKGHHEFGSDYNDDPLWLVISTCAYLKETGDFNFLKILVPYENNKSKAMPLYEHLIRALTFTLTHKGPHQLPLIGRADWNDCLNLNTRNEEPGLLFSEAPTSNGKIAESVLIAMIFTYAAKEFRKVAQKIADKEKVKWISEEIEKMEYAINEHAWDGEWWLRAYDSRSEKIGSNECDEGKIYIEPQGWAVIADVGGYERQKKALDSVKKYLATKHGLILHYPAYTVYDAGIGEISTYPPGYKENAGIFCHANSWIIIAEALLKNYKRALEYYLAICPARKEAESNIHKCEPYVYCQMIAGKDAVLFGEGKNSWLTGTSSWSFVAISQYILGIKPEFDGLTVNPCVPKSAGSFKVRRVFRGTTYNLVIKMCSKGNSYYIEGNSKYNGRHILHKQGVNERNITVICSQKTPGR